MIEREAILKTRRLVSWENSTIRNHYPVCVVVVQFEVAKIKILATLLIRVVTSAYHSPSD